MFREFFRAPRRADAAVAWGGLVVIVCHALYSAYIKFAVNKWYAKFYDHMQTAGEFAMLNGTATNSTAFELVASQEKIWDQMVVFWRLVAPVIIVTPTARWMRSHWALRWRLCLMRSYMEAWDPNAPHGLEASFGLCCDTAL